MIEPQRVEVTLYGELIIYSASGAVIYQGKPDGHLVESACAALNGNVLVFLRFGEKKRGAFNNLILLRPDGTVIWRAELPNSSSGDAYVEFQFSNGKLFANSWSGYRVEIDVSSGKLLTREFVK
jgi:outer membrane protein assembly factor BamB